MARSGLLLFSIVMGSAATASAHGRSVSWSNWTGQGDTLSARFRVRATSAAEVLVGVGLESGAVGPAELVTMRRIVRDRVASGVLVTLGASPCTARVHPHPARLAGSMLVVDATWRCPGPVARDELVIEVDLLPWLGRAHTHLLGLTLAGAEHEAALGVLSPRFERHAGGAVEDRGGTWRAARSFIWTGVLHIAEGADHLVFLGMLFLVVWAGAATRRGLLRELLLTATGFTVGHSITLALAVAGAIRPNEATVELGIALSICGLALEGFHAAGDRSAWVRFAAPGALAALPIAALMGWIGHEPRVLAGLVVFTVAYLEWVRVHPATVRRAVALVFGLVHGFGFAGVLLEARLSDAALAGSLLAFNVGVELGQAAILAVLAAVLWRLHRSAWRLRAVHAGAVVTLCLACWWIGQRAAG